MSAKQFFGVLVAFIIGAMYFGTHGDNKQASTPVAAAAQPPATAKKEEPPPPPPTPRIGEDVSEEFFKYIHHEVLFECQQLIKTLVKYDIRSPGIFSGTNDSRSMFFLLRFDRWSRYVASNGTIKLYGDAAEAQNGFGNWIPVNYSCTVDITNKTIVDGRLDNGRLP